MDTIRSFGIPVFVLLAVLLGWDYASNPGRYQALLMRTVASPVEPSPHMPTFAQVRSNLGKSSTIDSGQALNDGVPPWNANEKIHQSGRDRIRQSALNGLDKAWSTFCSGQGRKEFLGAVSYYFEMRGNQEESYAKRWGSEGAAYIKKEWSTPNDNRIERLIGETYERGYLDLASVKPFIAARIKPLVKDLRVQGQPCKT
jgi:hypothetical protein